MYGRLDGAVNNAGIAGRNELVKMHLWTAEDFDAIMRVNIRGVFLCLKYEIQQIKLQIEQDEAQNLARRDYAIVNMSSAAGLRGMGGQGPYNASKFAVMVVI